VLLLDDACPLFLTLGCLINKEIFISNCSLSKRRKIMSNQIQNQTRTNQTPVNWFINPRTHEPNHLFNIIIFVEESVEVLKLHDWSSVAVCPATSETFEALHLMEGGVELVSSIPSAKIYEVIPGGFAGGVAAVGHQKACERFVGICRAVVRADSRKNFGSPRSNFGRQGRGRSQRASFQAWCGNVLNLDLSKIKIKDEKLMDGEKILAQGDKDSLFEFLSFCQDVQTLHAILPQNANEENLRKLAKDSGILRICRTIRRLETWLRGIGYEEHSGVPSKAETILSFGEQEVLIAKNGRVGSSLLAFADSETQGVILEHVRRQKVSDRMRWVRSHRGKGRTNAQRKETRARELVTV